MKARAGHVLVELLLAVSIFTVIASSILGGFISARDGRVSQKHTLKAAGYLTEALEALRSIRERDWQEVSVNGIYHPVLDGTAWRLADGEETVGVDYTRRIELTDVFRDASGKISETGTVLDPALKRANITVSWGLTSNQSVSAMQLLSRFPSDATFEHTTTGDFEDGYLDGTAIQDDEGGEVILGAGGYGNWCKPTQVPFVEVSLGSNGNAAAIWAAEGRVFAGTGENSSGLSFVDIEVSNDNPPTAEVIGTLDGYKTNDVFGQSNYAYLATDSNDKEVVIVNTDTHTEVGYFNAPGSSDGNGVFVYGDVGYVTTGGKLYSFDLSSKTGPRPILDSNGVLVSIFGVAKKLDVVGNYAYVAIDGYALLELSIVNVSNPYNMSWVGGANVNASGGKEVYVNASGTRAYLATNKDSGKSEFFIINTSTKSGFRGSVGSYDAGGMDPMGVAIGTGNKALLVGSGGVEYQVIDISTESNPKSCGSLNTDYDINGVTAVLEQDGDAYAYIVAKDAGNELKIIEGGPGGQYASEGTFESEVFDVGAGNTVMFNRFEIRKETPEGTQLRMQVAPFSDGASSCSSTTPTYIGPDGTSASFFEGGGAVPFTGLPVADANPAKCFQYKLYLDTSDKDATPVFKSIKVNYSL